MADSKLITFDVQLKTLLRPGLAETSQLTLHLPYPCWYRPIPPKEPDRYLSMAGRRGCGQKGTRSRPLHYLFYGVN